MTRHGYGWWIWRWNGRTGRVWANDRFTAQHEAFEKLVGLAPAHPLVMDMRQPLYQEFMSHLFGRGGSSLGWFASKPNEIDVYREEHLIALPAAQ